MADVAAVGAAPRQPRALQGASLMMTAIALALATFMQVLDSTIANVSVPTIIGDLGGNQSQGAWIITAFAVANGISVPITGWLIQRFGMVRTFVGSVILFTAASAACGFAWNLETLIFFRVIQGAVAGPMMPGSQALLVMIFPLSRRSTALAIWGMTTLVAPICGPILGGYLSDNVHWSWIFLVNVPIGILCAWVCWMNLSSIETPTRKLPVDVIGFSLLVLWVGSLQIMLDTGKDADWFGSPIIVAEAIIAAICFSVWLIWETTDKHPIVDLSLFKSWNFTAGTIVFCLGYATFFGGNLLMPLWLQTQLGYIATWAGFVAAPAGAVGVIMTPIVARFTNKVDARILATIAAFGFLLSYAMRSNYSPDASFFDLMLPAIPLGVGLSMFFVSLMTICLNGLPVNQIAQGTALITFARLVTASFAISASTVYWDNQETVHQTRIAESAGGKTDPQWADAVRNLTENGASAAQASGALVREAVRQAYTIAILDIFHICMLITIALIPLIWLTKRAVAGGGQGGPGGGAH
jgi:MFS transporter, DHA2 family, multidrug resistance protein